MQLDGQLDWLSFSMDVSACMSYTEKRGDTDVTLCAKRQRLKIAGVEPVRVD